MVKSEWFGSPNYGYPTGTHGRGGHKVLAIVDHIMAGTLAGTDSHFKNPKSEVSAHFGVGKNGEIHQYVSIDDAAHHAGNIRKPSWPLLIPDNSTDGFLNPNLYTIGIEHEGQSGDEFTEAQYQATLALHRWLISEFGITPGPDTIIGHCRIDSVVKVNCPGKGFPWARLLNDLNVKYSYEDDRKWVIEQGISDGSDPDRPVLRKEVWAMLRRMGGR
jgi:N-acetyl-anhydromuramyl-L-alanine amidase AmpD